MLSYFNKFKFGISLALLVFFMNGLGGLVYLNVYKAVFRPKNDPGIMIWWLCCIKLGRTGNQLKEKKKKKQTTD